MNYFIAIIIAFFLLSSCGSSSDHDANVERLIREADSTEEANHRIFYAAESAHNADSTYAAEEQRRYYLADSIAFEESKH